MPERIWTPRRLRRSAGKESNPRSPTEACYESWVRSAKTRCQVSDLKSFRTLRPIKTENALVIIYHTETSRTDSISRSNAEQAIDKEERLRRLHSKFRLTKRKAMIASSGMRTRVEGKKRAVAGEIQEKREARA
jgi:hypothetical protein